MICSDHKNQADYCEEKKSRATLCRAPVTTPQPQTKADAHHDNVFLMIVRVVIMMIIVMIMMIIVRVMIMNLYHGGDKTHN